MTSNNSPDIDPSNDGTLAGSIRFAFKKLMQQVDGMLPAEVISYDRAANRANVQLLIAVVGTDGATFSRPQLASVPVLTLGGGGVMLSFPLNTGDLGWVIANDRDISNFLSSYSNVPPNSGRMKQFSDGLFIPDVMRGYTINAEDDAHAVLSTLDGSTRIALGEGFVKITAPTLIVEGDLSISGSMGGVGGSPINIAADLVLTGSYTQTGNMHVTGNIEATGTITPGV